MIDRRYNEFKDLHEHYVKSFPGYTFENFPSKFEFTRGKSLPLFTSYACPILIQTRVNCFNEMISQLSSNCSKVPDTYYLKWLELDLQLIVPL